MAFRVPLRPKVRLRALWAEDERLQPVIGRTLGTVECSPAPRPLIGVALESCAWMPFRGHEHTFSYRDAYDLPAAMTDDDLEHRGDHPASPAGGG